MFSKLVSLILILCLNQGLVKAIQPVERSVGRLKISIDPRMELLSTIQLLSSNYPIINRDLPHSKDIINYFSSFSLQEAVTSTDSLLQKFGFAFDAPVSFMLHLSQPTELEPQIKFSDYLLGRSGRGDNLEKYRKAIKQFAETSNFEIFWNSKIPFYNQILDMTIADMLEKDLIKAMEDYFKETKESYNIIIAPAFRGGYAPRITDADGKVHIYACLSTNRLKDDIPYLSGDNILYYVWHEFGHSFVNPLSEKHSDKVASSSMLLEPIKNQMARQAYANWETVVNEHIIRAVHVRLIELHIDFQQSQKQLDNEKSNNFIYIEPLVDKLKDFERQSNENQITFSEFYPELLNVLDNLLKIEYWKQFDLSFQGPIRNVFVGRLSFVYPTQDLDTEALKIAQNYVIQFFNNNLPLGAGILLADTTALKTDLSEYLIMAFGTIESNLFLKEYASSFPFKIENQIIYADKEYVDKDIKFVSCVPNPHNPNHGMMIATALSNRAIQDIINLNLLGGGDDYILFLNSGTVISRGVYKKNGKWTF